MILTKIYSGKEIYLDTNDIRAQWIEKQKGTQPEKVSLLRKICKKEKITNLYDLGANYGEFSVIKQFQRMMITKFFTLIQDIQVEEGYLKNGVGEIIGIFDTIVKNIFKSNP